MLSPSATIWWHRTVFLGTLASVPVLQAKGCSYLVLWLDCDREGENICYEAGQWVLQSVMGKYWPTPPCEVMDNAVPYMSSAGGQQQVWRAQFSSLAPVDLKRAMANLGSPNKDMSDSVDARADAGPKSRWPTFFDTRELVVDMNKDMPHW